LIYRSLENFAPTGDGSDHSEDHDDLETRLERTQISTPLRMSNSGTPATPQSARRYIDGLNTPSRSIIKVAILNMQIT